MSNVTVTIGTETFDLGNINVKRNKREKDPTTGKVKSTAVQVPLIVPVISNRADAIRLFGALYDATEKLGPGNGLKVVHSLIQERAEWGEMALGERSDSSAPYAEAFTSPERPRSAGLSEKDILEEMATLGLEVSHLGQGLRGGDSWTTVVDEEGKPRFASEEALILRFSSISERLEGLTAQLAQRQARSADAKRKREEKAKAAAVAAAAPAPAN